ncbi:MAG: hypothetical protein IPP48_02160 [Chitinophagaceae bacterium]|nr:hypothetical protein [Chitinophagaceae bacterium]
MGDNNNNNNAKSRRWFLSLFTAADKKATSANMVKMLTADGKIVEVDKAILEKASKKQKATNKEIFDWMDNPSKEK